MQAESWEIDEPLRRTEETVVTGSLSEFVSRLSSRTQVPSHRLEEYLTWPDQDLRQEVQTVSKLLKRFSKAVVSSMEDTATINVFLREIDLNSISPDHDWRSIFSALRHEGSGHAEHKRAMLIKYLQYLTFRKRLLEFLCLRRPDLEQSDGKEHKIGPPLAIERREKLPKRSSRPPVAHHSGYRDFVRLPLGEPIELPLPAGRELKLMLAGHMFRVIGATPPILVDQHGVTYFLKEGKNMVGRHPQSDVVANPDFRDISRAHLIIEWRGNHAVRVTDLSSRGTFVALQHLMPAPRPSIAPLHAPANFSGSSSM